MAEVKVERKRNRSILPWLLGLLLLGLILWGLTQCSDDEVEEVPVAQDTTMAPAPAAAPMAAAGTLGVAQILSNGSGGAGQNVSGSATVAEVVSDRGFWVEEAGQRLFVVMGEPQASEQAVQIQQGQTVNLSGTVQGGGSGAQLPGGLEAEARQIAEQQPVYLMVMPRDVQIQGQGNP